MSEGFITVTLSEIASFEMGNSPRSKYVSEEPPGVPFLQGNAEFGTKTPSHDRYCSRPNKVSRPGDILISVRAPVGDVNLSDRAYCIGRGLAAIRFYQLHDSFGWHLLNYSAGKLDKYAQGSTFKAVNKSHLENLKVLIPESRAMQRRIAKVLDTVDAAIQQTDAVIAKQQQVKKGLLQDLLTRGLDEEGRLRDPERHPEQFKESPLGRIPRDWEVSQLEALLEGRPRNGYSPKQAKEWTGVSMLGLGCLTAEGFEPLQLKDAPVDDPRIERAILQDGDLLVSRSNTRGRVALAGIYRDVGVPCIYPDLMMRISSNSQTTNRFLEVLLRYEPVRRQLTGAAQGTSGSMVKINAGTLLGVKVPVVPRDEQDRVLAFIDEQNAFILAEREYRKKTQRLKAGLLQDLLTGRVRVPEAEEIVSEVVA